jgi:lipid-A-disaccharide synthase-like uncharacterized protein
VTWATGLLAGFVCSVSSMIVWLIAYALRKKSPLLGLIASLIPGAIVLIYALRTHSLLYILVAILILIGGLLAPVYERNIAEVHIGGLALAVPFILFAICLFPLNLGTISSASLLQLYSATFQSILTLIGLMFTLGVFVFGTRTLPNLSLVVEMLKQFLQLFVVVSVLALLGMLTLRGDVDVSQSALISSANLFTYNTLAASILIAILSLLVSSIVYLIDVFEVFTKGIRESKARV